MSWRPVCVDLFTARVAAGAASTASEASGLHWLVGADWQLHCSLEVGASEKWYFQAAKKICIPPSMVNYHSGPLEPGGRRGNPPLFCNKQYIFDMILEPKVWALLRDAEGLLMS